ncbi:MAG: hypothetical protein M5U28_20455 [Sandaracinaceae bacterium]|nr:hypothetical protein [Sandaracinaceae bacterium]
MRAYGPPLHTAARAPGTDRALHARMRHLTAALACVFLPGCFLFMQDGSLVSFPVVYELPEQTVEGNLLGGLLGSLLPLPIELDVDLEAETRARDTGPAQHVYLTGFRLFVTPTAESSGDRDDFSFLDSIEVYVESRRSGSSLPRRRIAAPRSRPPTRATSRCSSTTWISSTT